MAQGAAGTAVAGGGGGGSFFQRSLSKLKGRRTASKSRSPPRPVQPAAAEPAAGPAAGATEAPAVALARPPAPGAAPERGAGAEQARETLADMLAANARYADEEEFRDDPHPASPYELRKELAENGQKPVATVIACADSRTPPEIVFRGTVGSLFVLRTAGNVTDSEAVLASVEYAVAVLKTPLVLVMGHEMCGAVKASVEYKRDAAYGESLPANLSRHVEKMAACLPGMESFAGLGEDALTTSCVEAHTRAAAAALPVASAVLRQAVDAGSVLVVAAVYDLVSGLVRVL